MLDAGISQEVYENKGSAALPFDASGDLLENKAT
jgi:hypothetical protein